MTYLFAKYVMNDLETMMEDVEELARRKRVLSYAGGTIPINASQSIVFWLLRLRGKSSEKTAGPTIPLVLASHIVSFVFYCRRIPPLRLFRELRIVAESRRYEFRKCRSNRFNNRYIYHGPIESLVCFSRHSAFREIQSVCVRRREPMSMLFFKPYNLLALDFGTSLVSHTPPTWNDALTSVRHTYSLLASDLLAAHYKGYVYSEKCQFRKNH
jgi:hypothetical protein